MIFVTVERRFAIYLPQIILMNATEGTGKWWLYFFISAIAITIMLVMPMLRPWFWLVLPFVVTTFARAMRIM